MTSLFNNPSPYNGYILYFLKENILYTTIKPVILSKTKYNYRVKNLSNDDTFALNKLLHVLSKDLCIDKRNFYLNSKEIKLEDHETKGFIDILIQGYKISPSSTILPILKLYDVDYTNEDTEVDDTPDIQVGSKWLNKPLQ